MTTIIEDCEQVQIAGVSQKVATAVAAAIHRLPGSTATELANDAGLGRSTVTKALAGLEKAGLARRMPGGRDGALRLPDTWSPSPPPATDAADTCQQPATPPEIAAGPRPQLGKGELRQLVADHLASHPDQEFSPHQLAKALERSTGAVTNACERLVTKNQVMRTSDKPRRYRAAMT